jgi:HEAT repeat protein
MSERRPRRAGLWIAGILGVLVLAAVGWGVFGPGRPARPSAVVYNERTPLAVLTQGLREGDARALLILFPRIAAQTVPVPRPVDDAEAKELIEILESTRTGFLRFGSYGRVSSQMLVSKILERFAVEGASGLWFQGLRPVHDLFASGLADDDLQTRIAALKEVGRFWTWYPGRTMMPAEEKRLVDWKAPLYSPVLRRLGDRAPQSRAAAVTCLSLLPDDEAAAKALAYLEDRSEGGELVRQQVLVSFASRPALLTEDLVLKRLHDPEPAIAQTAEILLKTRGLTQEQIELGRLIFDPRPDHRGSVIARLRDRTDIDPIVWLLQLSRDADDTVRAGAVGALADRPSPGPDVLQRLGELARTDRSPAVRQAAAKLVPDDPNAKPGTATASPIPMPRRRTRPAAGVSPQRPEATVALPPLPGSAHLNPKAN